MLTSSLPRVVLYAALPRRVGAVRQVSADGSVAYFVRGANGQADGRIFGTAAAFARYIVRTYSLITEAR